MKPALPLTLERMYETGFVVDRKNNQRKATESTISKAEALVLMEVVSDIQALVTLETGLAFGASALAICRAKQDIKTGDRMHYGIDPNQIDFYNEAALVSLEKENLKDQFKLLNGPSHLMIPELIRDQVKLDFAFIDGWHTFDYTLIDFFLIDKILRPGGVVAFHDMYGLSKQKVLRFLLGHRKYRIEKKYAVRKNEDFLTTLKFFVWRLFKYPSLLFSWFHWNYQLFNSSGLIVLKKLENFEPDYSFYKSF
jgi:predicted O-methyltransferase YrrM